MERQVVATKLIDAANKKPDHISIALSQLGEMRERYTLSQVCALEADQKRCLSSHHAATMELWGRESPSRLSQTKVFTSNDTIHTHDGAAQVSSFPSLREHLLSGGERQSFSGAGEETGNAQGLPKDVQPQDRDNGSARPLPPQQSGMQLRPSATNGRSLQHSTTSSLRRADAGCQPPGRLSCSGLPGEAAASPSSLSQKAILSRIGRRFSNTGGTSINSGGFRAVDSAIGRLARDRCVLSESGTGTAHLGSTSRLLPAGGMSRVTRTVEGEQSSVQQAARQAASGVLGQQSLVQPQSSRLAPSVRSSVGRLDGLVALPTSRTSTSGTLRSQCLARAQLVTVTHA